MLDSRDEAHICSGSAKMIFDIPIDTCLRWQATVAFRPSYQTELRDPAAGPEPTGRNAPNTTIVPAAHLARPRRTSHQICTTRSRSGHHRVCAH
jgi:hypothetical protein